MPRLGDSLYLILLMTLLSWSTKLAAAGDRKVPYLFNFGDSMTANGNNKNYVFSLSKVNFRPYGIDFPGGVPTGRFTNGRTYVDFFCELLGLDNYIPPFNLSASEHDGSNGINYASGGAGILDLTGKLIFGKVASFSEQIQNHELVVQKLSLIGNSSIPDLLKSSLYTISVGSNDYLDKYFSRKYKAWNLYTPEAFAKYLINNYRTNVLKLYRLGARKMVFIGIGLVACIPLIKQYSSRLWCDREIADGVMVFNYQLLSLVDELNRELRDANCIYVNATAFQLSAMQSFKVIDKSCCQTVIGVCIPLSQPCSNRADYIFWDGFHPTEAVHEMVGQKAYFSQNPNEAYPMNIGSLVEN